VAGGFRGALVAIAAETFGAICRAFLRPHVFVLDYVRVFKAGADAGRAPGGDKITTASFALFVERAPTFGAEF
jgi:hypothetical protein